MNKTSMMIGALLGTLAAATEAKADSLYVFVPTDAKAQSLEDGFAEKCPDLDVTVFGRVQDFLRQMDVEPPDAILAPAPAVQRYEAYHGALRGVRDGEVQENYVLLSVGEPVDTDSIGELRVGVIDILGREGTPELLEQLFGEPVESTRVTRSGDLLPLLMFDDADAVLVSERTAQDLREQSRAELKVTSVDITLGLVTTGVESKDGIEKYEQCLDGLGAEINNAVDVEEWKTWESE